MSLKTEKIKAGYSELNYEERNEIKEFIRKFDAAGDIERRNLSESASRAANKSVGPKFTDSCPCCGK